MEGKKMKHAKLLLLGGLLISMTSLSVQAELPPTVYADMKEKAAIKAKILVTKVVTSLPPAAADLPPEKAVKQPVNIDVTAKVIQAQRGGDVIGNGKTIQISYGHEYRAPGFVGPGLVPIVLPGKMYEAYLGSDAATPGVFVPAAGAMSFEPVEK